MAPLIDLACDARRHILAFLDATGRHAFRAVCSVLYETGPAHHASTALRVPVDNRYALAACKERKRHSDTASRCAFWGSLVRDRVVLLFSVYSGPVAVCQQFCLALAALMPDWAPAVVEVCFSCYGEPEAREVALLNWLADTGPWPRADIELTKVPDLVIELPADLLGSKLRSRLTRCDAVLEFTNPPKKFPVLRNLACFGEPCEDMFDTEADWAAAFPAVEHFISDNGAQLTEFLDCVDSFGRRPTARMTVRFKNHSSVLDELLANGDPLGVLCLNGPQNMAAAEVTMSRAEFDTFYQRQDHGATSVWLSAAGHREAPISAFPNCVEMFCMRPYMACRDEVAECSEAIADILCRAPALRRLHLDPLSVAVDRLHTLPDGLRVLDLAPEIGTAEWRRPARDDALHNVVHAVGLMSARCPRGLPRQILAPEATDVDIYCQSIERALVAKQGDAPQVWLPLRTAWVYGGRSDKGPGTTLIRVTGVAITAGLSAADIHTEPPAWAHSVVRIELRPPLDASMACTDAASRLCGAFGGAQEVACLVNQPNTMCVDVLRSVCVAMGPRLRLLVVCRFALDDLTPALEQACPWTHIVVL